MVYEIIPKTVKKCSSQLEQIFQGVIGQYNEVKINKQSNGFVPFSMNPELEDMGWLGGMARNRDPNWITASLFDSGAQIVR